ncbi:DinB family protein [Pseudonocardia sp. NPDC049635]|uniref:DinB family protein n=1 Tax=Pseudonocardia sp. NPDC049635 TaxID=3155506 RepID=UPI0033ED81A5
MTTTDRAVPPTEGTEIATLDGWLDFYRATLIARCSGLGDDRLRVAPLPPSSMTLLGLVRHLAAVERHWFRVVLAGEGVPPLFDPEPGTGHDGGFELDDSGIGEALAVWEREVASARAARATAGPDGAGSLGGRPVSARWIVVHMIAEYARHCGHADLIRERLDGRTGV